MLYVDKTFHRSARTGWRVLRGAAAIAIRSAVRPPLIAVAAISLAALAAIASFEVTDFDPVSPAFAQTPGPVTLSGVFDPDVADIRPDAVGKLQEAAKKAHRDCYPPESNVQSCSPRGGFHRPLFGLVCLRSLRPCLSPALESRP